MDALSGVLRSGKVADVQTKPAIESPGSPMPGVMPEPVHLARQEDLCWRCGTDWASESAPRTTLQVLATGVPVIVPLASVAGIAATVAADRWTDEGGSFDSDPPGLDPAAAGRG